MASISNPNGKLVLVAEDEDAIVRAITVALAKAGFRAIVAENGAAGLEAFLAEPDAVDLVLADVVMPSMDGITMAREIRNVRPDIPVLFMSAYPQKTVKLMNGAEFPFDPQAIPYRRSDPCSDRNPGSPRESNRTD